MLYIDDTTLVLIIFKFKTIFMYLRNMLKTLFILLLVSQIFFFIMSMRKFAIIMCYEISLQMQLAIVLEIKKCDNITERGHLLILYIKQNNLLTYGKEFYNNF